VPALEAFGGFIARHRTGVRWLLAVALLGVAAGLLRSNPGPARLLLSVPWPLVAALALLALLNQLLMSWRIALAVAYCGGRGVSAIDWFKLTSVGQFLNVFVPQLGNIHRAVVLKRDHGIAYMSYASGLFAFVWLDLLMGSAVALVVIGTLDPKLSLAGVPAVAWLALIAGALFVGPWIAARAIRALRLPGVVGRALGRLSSVVAPLSGALTDRAFLLRFLGVNILTTAGHVAALWLAFYATGGALSLGALVLFQIFIKLSNQVMVTPGNLGFTELAYGVLAHVSEHSLEQGLAASFLIRVVGTASITVLGLVSVGSSWLISGQPGIGDSHSAEVPDAERRVRSDGVAGTSPPRG
jgi:uncharacterized membrane protein YbhN (UPF0104 family)